VNLDDLAAARDALAAEVGERAGSHALERLARAHRWLGEEDAARGRFAAAARAAEAALERFGRDDPTPVARVGSLLWRARDQEAARPWLERALRGGLRADDAAGVEYLLGSWDDAVASADRASGGGAPDPWAAAIGALARARRDGDAAAAAAAGDGFVELIRRERTPPDEESGSSSLSLFDWLEEAERVRAELEAAEPPDHAELLERAGLLRAERAPERPQPPPDAAPGRPGTATIAYPAPDGGDVEARVSVDERGDIHFLLHPARDLRAALVQANGLWRARLGDTELPGTFRGPRAAKRALWDPLREQPDGQWAVALLDRLFREAFRL
jgi:hypothetical protein